MAEAVARAGVSARLDSVALPDERLAVDFPAKLYERYGLTVAGVVENARALLER